MQADLSPDIARQPAEMAHAFSEGRIGPAAHTSASTAPTTFESFAAELAQAYAQA